MRCTANPLVRWCSAALAATMLASCAGARNGAPAQAAGGPRAKVDALFVPAPCPPPDAVNPLQGIEGWAPGAGKAQEMGQSAGQSMGGFAGALGGAAPSPTPTPSAPPANCKQLSPTASQFFANAAAARSSAPAGGYDVAARAAQFHDVRSAYAYVRDAIRTDAYAGSMRGSAGTLMARAGSPADKAVLLAALLAAQNVSVRFVHATLSDADGQQIVPVATAPRTFVSPAPWEKFGDDALARYLRAGQTQLSTIVAAGVKIAGDTNLQQRLLANVRDHWWLQIEQNGQWTDADPSLSGLALGSHLGPAPIASDGDLTALPDDVKAQVTLRLLADTGDAKNLRTIAQATVPAADAIAQPLTISMNAGATDLAAVAKQTSFTSNITLGSSSTDGETLTPDDPSARLRVLYVEVQTAMAGAQPLVERHVVVDRRAPDGSIDPAWTPQRTAYALTFAYRGMEMVGDLDPVLALSHDFDAITRYGILLDYAAQHPGKIGLPQSATSDYPIDAQRFFVYDAGLRIALMQRDPSLWFLYDHPQLTFYRQSFALTNGRLVQVLSYDVVDNAMLAIGKDAAAAANANAVRGLADTAVERALLRGGGEAFDTQGLFAATDRQRVGRVLVTPSSLEKAPVLARDGLAGTLGPSTVAYAPAGYVQLHDRASYGWLSIDTVTGNAVGRMESGAGQALSEYVIKMYENWPYIQVIGNCLRCTGVGMAEALAGNEEHGQHYVECMADALCEFVADLVIGKFTKMGLGAGGVDHEEIEWVETAISRLMYAQGKFTGANPGDDICKDLLGGGE